MTDPATHREEFPSRREQFEGFIHHRCDARRLLPVLHLDFKPMVAVHHRNGHDRPDAAVVHRLHCLRNVHTTRAGPIRTKYQSLSPARAFTPAPAALGASNSTVGALIMRWSDGEGTRKGGASISFLNHKRDHHQGNDTTDADSHPRFGPRLSETLLLVDARGV